MSRVSSAWGIVSSVHWLVVWCFGFRFYGFKLLVEVGREYVNPPLLRRLHPLDEELQNEIKGYCALSYSDEISV